MLQEDKPGLWFMFLVNVSNEVNGSVKNQLLQKNMLFLICVS